MSIAVGRLTCATQDARSWRLEFELPAPLMRFVAAKGSICGRRGEPHRESGGRPQIRREHHSHTPRVTTLGDLVVDAE